MQTYQALKIITLHSGQVELTADQARRRIACLEGKNHQKSGVFSVVKPVQFKAGEIFGYDADVPKAQAGQLVKTTSRKKAAANQAEPEAAQ